MIYRHWCDVLPRAVEVVPVEMPGRGSRPEEPPYKSLAPLIERLTEAIDPLLDKPYAFFGHSMGALVAFELACSIRERSNREPLALFVSGRRAPQVPDDKPLTYSLPDPQFIDELRRLQGTPEEVLEHDELMELLLPLLRADFQIVQTYEYLPRKALRCPISVYGGLSDSCETRDRLLAWAQHTSVNLVLHMLPGDHFFLRSSQSLLLEMLARELLEVITRSEVLASRTTSSA